MTTVIYNCKRCKVGRRVEYPLTDSGRYAMRRDENGKHWNIGAHVRACGGGKPTEYGGDPLGLCPKCGHCMTYGVLVAHVVEDHACDARCTGARGPSCDCSCGGANHGRAWG